MDYTKLNDTYILRIDRGEEIVKKLEEFCENEDIKVGTIEGLGAVDRAEIGLFVTGEKEYHSTVLTGDHEITSLKGNITRKDGEVYLHLHINLSDESYNTRGGHLNSATVSGTCEVFVREVNGNIGRKFDEKVGLNLFDF
ncbi:MAG: PPC domain-containing DNA-binding protein [Halothermotrichaceae bacterium]